MVLFGLAMEKETKEGVEGAAIFASKAGAAFCLVIVMARQDEKSKQGTTELANSGDKVCIEVA